MIKRAWTQLILLVVVVAAALAAVTWVNQTAREMVAQAVRHNFAAAGLLAKIQVEGERMRRYEKEMFIYAAQADARAKYAKEFDGAYTKLLSLTNDAAALGHKGFSDEDRTEIAKWLDAAAFYGNEFRRVTAVAQNVSPDQTTGLTLTLNNEIKAGKDRFRVLLDGSSAMREKKEQQAMAINDSIDQVFDRELKMLMLIGGLITLAAVARLLMARPADRGTASADPLVRKQLA